MTMHAISTSCGCAVMPTNYIQGAVAALGSIEVYGLSTRATKCFDDCLLGVRRAALGRLWGSVRRLCPPTVSGQRLA